MNNKDDTAGTQTDETLSRRDVLRNLAVLVGGAVVASKVPTVLAEDTPPHTTPGGSSSIRQISEMQSVPRGAGTDILVQMQEDVRRALLKPVEQRQWRMVIDTRKCVGCHACTVACISENKLPPKVVYRPVRTEETGVYPVLKTRFLPQPCMHCDAPPCVPVCPADATWKRPDNVVVVDYDRCIGCAACVDECPYHHRSIDDGLYYTKGTPAIQPYEGLANHEYGKSWSRQNGDSPVEKARKCHFCLHRLQEGELPMCVSTCIGRANVFGDANDPDSLIAAALRESNQFRLLEEKGTQPTVVYLT